jgi:ketosteroid isomerase-like protein
MSQKNVEIVRRAFDAFTRGDIEAVLRLCDEDIVITQAQELPGVPPQQRGHEGVSKVFAYWPEQWDDYRIEMRGVIADPGDYVVVGTRERGRGKQSGVDVEAEFTFVFTVRDEKVTELRTFVGESQALEAVGLSE